MKIKHITNPHSSEHFDNDSKLFALADKPFKCTFCCLARPVMTTTLMESNTVLSSVVEKWECDIKFVISDEKDRKWTVKGPCCTLGVWCPACSDAHFDIVDNDGNVGGNLKKKAGGCQEVIGDASQFELTFPEKATPEDRLSLIVTTLMIDYNHFEDDKNKDVE